MKTETQPFTCARAATQRDPIYQESPVITVASALYATAPTSGGEEYKGKGNTLTESFKLCKNPMHFTKLLSITLTATPQKAGVLEN